MINIADIADLGEKKDLLIEEILKGEWIMFVEVNELVKANNPAMKDSPSCSDFPEEFRVHRESKLISWSIRTLQSYLGDILEARKNGRNLMTYKYARMDNLIPSENSSPLIDSIVVDLVDWQKDFIKKYPSIMAGGRKLSGGTPGVDWASFENYLRCELECYSEKTLESLTGDIDTYKREGKSMSDEVYLHLVRAKGYDSLEQAEAKG